MTKKLFVGGLSWDTTDAGLQEFFAAAGTVVSATVIKDKYNGRSKGFGFVEFATEEEAEKAKTELNGKELDGRSISVDEARPQQPRENNFGGGGGGGGSFGRRDNRGGDRRGGRDNRGGDRRGGGRF